MPREVVVFHDINSHAFAFTPHLQRFVRGNFVSYAKGVLDLPATRMELAQFVINTPEHVVFHAVSASPVYGSFGEVIFHPVIAICHPIMQMLARLAGWSRNEWERTHGEALANASALGVMVDFIRQRMQEPWRMYPPADFHVSFLSGEFHVSDPETAADLAARVVKDATLVLADFPQTVEPSMLAKLVQVGAPLLKEAQFTCHPANNILSTLRHWREALPPGLFDELCQLTAADFAFYDHAAPAVVARMPVSAETRDDLMLMLDEAADITRHRLRRQVRVRRTSDESNRDRMVEADPLLGYRYRPNEAFEQIVLGRNIVMETDELGYRPVPGQPKAAEKSLAAYGCSFTYGFVIQADETFCAILQQMFPTWRIENHGVNGYGTHQNLIQLQRDSYWGLADYVAFCFIPSHLTRNVATASCLGGFGRFTWQSSPVQFYPRASLEPDGSLTLRRVSIKRPELQRLRLEEFDPDPYYLDQVCFALLTRAAEIVHAQGKHFFVVTLRNYPSDYLLGLMKEAGIPFVDAHVPWEDQFTNDPDDGHPNALANQIFAERIQSYVLGHIGSGSL